jgi:hypothetical protein
MREALWWGPRRGPPMAPYADFAHGKYHRHSLIDIFCTSTSIVLSQNILLQNFTIPLRWDQE